MTTENTEQTQIQPEQDAEKTDINVPRLLDFYCGMLANIVLRNEKNKSKAFFKELKAGKNIAIGQAVIEDKITLELKTRLDYQDFRGPGFNHDVFCSSINQLMIEIGSRLKAKQDLNIKSDGQGNFLVDLPAGISVKGQLNVMMLVMQFGTRGEVNMFLSYTNPDEFRIKGEGANDNSSENAAESTE